MTLKAQLYIFRRFFVMQYLSICKLRPIFIGLKFIRMQQMGLIFQNISRGSMPPDTPGTFNDCGACLLRASGARPFAAAPLMKYALTKDPTN